MEISKVRPGVTPHSHANTLCLSNIFVAHPILEGGDGIALDRVGNIWVDANERNAVAFVTRHGKVFEVFRNPVELASWVEKLGRSLRWETTTFLNSQRARFLPENYFALPSPTVIGGTILLRRRRGQRAGSDWTKHR